MSLGNCGLAAKGGEMVYYATLILRSNMKLQHWMAVLLTLWILGCQTPPPATQPAPREASLEDIQRIRAAYKAQDPAVDVGVVDDVLAAENLASVSEVNVANFKNGDIVCFVDGTTSPLVCGQVVRVTETQVHVKYENPAPDRRAPMKGDLAVAYK